ncbi:alpha/beta hydrolase, partial [Nocardioides sp.]|uniref:alpha/beta hydrolase n=1 Tax=Nocardioides sp. TaxID=35761 RepID=UPI002C48D3DA
GVRPDRILVAGASAGGGLAAGVALAARDRGGPRLCGQVLDYPMLDDRGITASTGQFDGIGVWDRISNETGWRALLGDRRGGELVSPYAAPSRATDLGGLPPAFIGVGAAEIFRDEAIDYADRIWRAGGDAELHVWAGAFHACDIFAPHTNVGRTMIRTRNTWVEKVLGD